MERELRSRSASTEKRYVDSEVDEQQHAETSMDDYHRSKSSKKYVVVQAARDGMTRIIDYTKKHVNSKLKLSEIDFQSGAYGDEFVDGNVVYAHFPKTRKTAPGHYEAYVVGTFDSQDKALEKSKSLTGRTGKQQVVKPTAYQSMQRLAGFIGTPEPDGSVAPSERSFSATEVASESSFTQQSGSSFVSLDGSNLDTPASPAGTSENSFRAPTSPTTPSSMSSLLGSALNSISGIEQNIRRTPAVVTPSAVPVLDVRNGLPVSAHEDPYSAPSSQSAPFFYQTDNQFQATPALPNLTGTFAGNGNSAAAKRKRSSRGGIPEVTMAGLEKYHNKAAVPRAAMPAQTAVLFESEVEYPIIRTQGGRTTYEFSWSKRRDVHQEPLMPGYPIYVYPSAMKQAELYAPTPTRPKVTKYAWELVKQFMGGEKGVVRCYESQKGNYGIDKFLGETTVAALVVYIKEEFSIKDLEIGAFKALMNPKLNQLYKRKRAKYVEDSNDLGSEHAGNASD